MLFFCFCFVFSTVPGSQRTASTRTWSCVRSTEEQRASRVASRKPLRPLRMPGKLYLYVVASVVLSWDSLWLLGNLQFHPLWLYSHPGVVFKAVAFFKNRTTYVCTVWIIERKSEESDLELIFFYWSWFCLMLVSQFWWQSKSSSDTRREREQVRNLMKFQNGKHSSFETLLKIALETAKCAVLYVCETTPWNCYYDI